VNDYTRKGSFVGIQVPVLTPACFHLCFHPRATRRWLDHGELDNARGSSGTTCREHHEHRGQSSLHLRRHYWPGSERRPLCELDRVVLGTKRFRVNTLPNGPSSIVFFSVTHDSAHPTPTPPLLPLPSNLGDGTTTTRKTPVQVYIGTIRDCRKNFQTQDREIPRSR